MKKFLVCKNCGNLVEVIEGKDIPIICCGNNMEHIVPNTVEASIEKHKPVVNLENGCAHIIVGSTIHPMEENHYIKWIYVETNIRSLRYNFKHGDKPEILVNLDENEKIINVYAFCNLHGLWSQS